MPKVECDETLMARVQEVIKSCGSINAAATKLGVERPFLWRFQQTGRCIGRSKAQLVQGLERLESETNFPKNETLKYTTNLSTSIAIGQLMDMRNFFQNMLHLIDAYIANPVSPTSFAELAQAAGDGLSRHRDAALMGEKNGHSE